MAERGFLKISVVSAQTNVPVIDAEVHLSANEEFEQAETDETTDLSGQTNEISLNAPPRELSLDVTNTIIPYASYNLSVNALGYEPATVEGVEIFAGQLALLQVRLNELPFGPNVNIIIPEHTLVGNFPPKIPEEPIKPIEDTGEIVLSRVVVPEIVVVHNGTPGDENATDYYVPYRDYIKNVASCEIYSTWPRETLIANILVIQSFTLNRVYTEWYRNKGYNFTITSSTAYDQKWVPGRNIFEEIDVLVDEVFENYLSLPNVKQPILTQYCDGKRVSCPDWLSQWGSKYLGDQGLSASEILRNYYGDEIYINSAEQISGIPASWPGYDLTIGASGDKVRQLQEQLLTISEVYTAIPSLVPDGMYGELTQESVRAFQDVFGLPQTGIVNYRTWYKISQIYVGITGIGEGI